MDFSNINTAADADKGAILHFKHPQSGHLLYTGKGADEFGRLADKSLPYEAVTARVRGLESQAMSNAIKSAEQRLMKSPDAANDPEHRFDTAIALVTELHGVMDGKRVLAASRDDLKWLFERSENLAVQVVQFAGDSANFFAGNLTS